MKHANDIRQAVANGIECANANFDAVTITFNGKQVRLEANDTIERGVERYYQEVRKDYVKNGDGDSLARCDAQIRRLQAR